MPPSGRIEGATALSIKRGRKETPLAYDKGHGTQLPGTLACLVRDRSSYVDIYEELFIHRSALAYQLERICALTGLDLSDAHAWGTWRSRSC